MIQDLLERHYGRIEFAHEVLTNVVYAVLVMPFEHLRYLQSTERSGRWSFYGSKRLRQIMALMTWGVHEINGLLLGYD